MKLKTFYQKLAKDKFLEEPYSKRGIVTEQITVATQQNEIIDTETYTEAESDKLTPNDILIAENVRSIVNRTMSNFKAYVYNHGKPVEDVLSTEYKDVYNEIVIPYTLDENFNRKVIEGCNFGFYTGDIPYDNAASYTDMSLSAEPNNTSITGFYGQQMFINVRSTPIRVIPTVEYDILSSVYNEYRKLSRNGKRKYKNAVSTFISTINDIYTLEYLYFDTLEFKFENIYKLDDGKPIGGGGLISAFEAESRRMKAYAKLRADMINEMRAFKARQGVEIKKNYALLKQLDSEVIPDPGIRTKTRTTTKTVNVAKVTDLYKKNELVVTLLNGINSDVAYNVKSDPTPDSRLIKLPSKDAFCFVTPLDDTTYYLHQASNYDNFSIQIDNDLKVLIDALLLQIKCEYLYLNTGKNENKGLIVMKSSFETQNVRHIKMSSLDKIIELDENKGIIINAKDGKVGIGNIGKGSLSTKYDNDLTTLVNEKVYLTKIIEYFNSQMGSIDLKSTVMKGGELQFIDDRDVLKTITSLNYLLNIDSYDNYVKLRDELFELSENLKVELKTLSYDLAIGGSQWKPMTLADKFNSIIDKLISKSTPDIADVIGQNVLGSCISILKRDNNDYSWLQKQANIQYQYPMTILNRIMLEIKSINSKYYALLVKLIDEKSYYAKYKQEREVRESGTCSPEEALQIIIQFLMVDYITLTGSLNNLITLRNDEIKKKEQSKYEISEGGIWNKIINSLIGSVNSYTTNPSGTPAYILQTTGAEQILEQELKDILNNQINKLYIE